METIEKIEVNPGIAELKEKIKMLVMDQKFYKNQRRDVRLEGKRVISPYEASWRHTQGREQLRLYYAAYGLMRNKSFSVTENKYPEDEHPLHEYEEKINGIKDYYLNQEYEDA